MKKRLEDRLIELAFDLRQDSIPAEIAADPAAQLRLSEYRTMKSALGQLREVPEHQLSTERLREALLHQGLKKRFQFPWQLTAYSSVACAFVICALVANSALRTSHQLPQATGHQNPPAIASDSGSSAIMKMLYTNPEVPAPAPKREVALASVHHHAHQKLVVKDSGLRLTFNDDHPRDNFLTHSASSNLEAIARSKPELNSDARDGDNQPLGKRTSPAGKVQDAILVIHQGADSETGLDTAQEDHSKNVLVSG